jgi:RNase adapter protein RapZ
MKLIIVSGLSGAGKTIALHSLEDMGAYCIDNLPVGLLPAFAAQVDQLGIAHPWIAIGVDARTTALHDMPALLQQLSETHVHYEVLFLEATDAVLIKRFSETRRKHPLTSSHLPLAEAIRQERCLLEPLASRAHIRVDTSQMHVHHLRDMIRRRLNLQTRQNISLLFQSFGFKYGVPNDADFVFDMRCLPNPHWELELRTLTGCDLAVQNFLSVQPKVQQMQRHLIEFLEVWIPQFIADNRSYLTLALGCTGGQHRSVYMAEQLAAYFRHTYDGVLVRHRELL